MRQACFQTPYQFKKKKKEKHQSRYKLYRESYHEPGPKIILISSNPCITNNHKLLGNLLHYVQKKQNINMDTLQGNRQINWVSLTTT